MTAESTLLPCTFRRVYRGRTLCTRAVDEFDREVWTAVCARCAVPPWLQQGICRHLDIGVQIGSDMGEQAPSVLTACRFFGQRLSGVERCATCAEFSLWEEGSPSPAVQRLAAVLPPTAMRKAEEAAGSPAGARMMPGCFRAGVPHCLFEPAVDPRQVLIVFPSLPAQGILALTDELLHAGGLEGVLIAEPARNIDALCSLCLAIQGSARLVIDVSDWDSGALFTLGLGGALGRPALLIRERDRTPPFVPQGLPVYAYGSEEEYGVALVQGLGIPLEAAEQGEAAPGEGAEEGSGAVVESAAEPADEQDADTPLPEEGIERPAA